MSFVNYLDQFNEQKEHMIFSYKKQFHQKPSSFLAGNSSESRKDPTYSDVFDFKGKSNHPSQIFGSNISQFSGSTIERSYLNMNVRDSLTTEGNLGSIFDATDRKQNQLQDFFNLNQKYSTHPQNSSILSNNINSSPFVQTAQFGQKHSIQQSFLNYDSNNNNLTPSKLSQMHLQQQQQMPLFENLYEGDSYGTDFYQQGSYFPLIHSNGLQNTKYQYQKFKEEMNGLMQGDSRQPSSRENTADYFNSNLNSKRTNFRQSDGFYDPHIQQNSQQNIAYSQGNSTKAVDSIFGSGQGSKNQKFSNLFGSNNNHQRSLFENYSITMDQQDDSGVFRRDGQKKNSRSTSYLGDTSFTYQSQNQDLNSSYVNSNNAQNTGKMGQINSNSLPLNQAFRNKSQNQNSPESKARQGLIKENTSTNDTGYKVGTDFAKKLRLQKCESTGDFQMSNQQQNYQSSSNNYNQQSNKNGQIYVSEDLYAKEQKYPQKATSKVQTEESLRYSPSQETKTNISAYNFDSVTQEKVPTKANKEEKSINKGQTNEFSKQWEELNTFKKTQAEDQQKSDELTQKLISSNSTGKIDFKSIKLSRTPLQTIDIKQQLANIDQKAKLEAYGESMQPPELIKIDQIVPQLLQKNTITQNSTQKTQQSQDEKSQTVKPKEQDISQQETIEEKQNINNKTNESNKNREKVHQKIEKTTKETGKTNQQSTELNEKSDDQVKNKGDKLEDQVKQSEKKIKGSDNNQTIEIKKEKQNSNIKEQNLEQSSKKQQEIKSKPQTESKSNKKQVEEQSQQNKNVIDEKQQQKEEQVKRSQKPQLNEQKQTENTLQNEQEPINTTIKQENQNKKSPVEVSQNKVDNTKQNSNKDQQNKTQIKNQQIDLPKNQNNDNLTPQNSSRGQVDIQGIVQNIRSIKQDLKQKRNSRNNQEDNVSKNSAQVLQTDSASTPQFQINSNQLTEFPQIQVKENGSHIENLKFEIFSDFGKKGRDSEQQVNEQEIEQNGKPQQVDTQANYKNKTKFQMEVIEEEVRTKNVSQEFSEQVNTRSSGMSFQQDFNNEQIEQEKQHELSFNANNNNQLMPTSNSSNNIPIDTEDPEDEVSNQMLQQELSIDLILKYQKLLNNSSNASVRNLPLEYTKEMVNLAYCILQTVRNCSQIPQNSDQDQQEEQEDQF